MSFLVFLKLEYHCCRFFFRYLCALHRHAEYIEYRLQSDPIQSHQLYRTPKQRIEYAVEGSPEPGTQIFFLLCTISLSIFKTFLLLYKGIAFGVMVVENDESSPEGMVSLSS